MRKSWGWGLGSTFAAKRKRVMTETSPTVLDSRQFLAHWMGHRALTRKVIAAFPSDEAFNSYSIGGMRPFSALVAELLMMTVPTLEGVIDGNWKMADTPELGSIDDALEQFDADTAALAQRLPEIPAARWHEVETAFGQWKMPVNQLFLYLLENEIHHRGQGYVYLRALDVDPVPNFGQRE